MRVLLQLVESRVGWASERVGELAGFAEPAGGQMLYYVLAAGR